MADEEIILRLQADQHTQASELSRILARCQYSRMMFTSITNDPRVVDVFADILTNSTMTESYVLTLTIVSR